MPAHFVVTGKGGLGRSIEASARRASIPTVLLPRQTLKSQKKLPLFHARLGATTRYGTGTVESSPTATADAVQL